MPESRFTTLLRDIRAVQAEDKTLPYRMLTGGAQVIADDMMGSLRGLFGEQEQTKEALEVLDSCNGEGFGFETFRELLRAVAEEDIAAARTALEALVYDIAACEDERRR